MAFRRRVDRGAYVAGVRTLARQPTRNRCLRETPRSDDSSIDQAALEANKLRVGLVGREDDMILDPILSVDVDLRVFIGVIISRKAARDG